MSNKPSNLRKAALGYQPKTGNETFGYQVRASGVIPQHPKPPKGDTVVVQNLNPPTAKK